MLLETIGKDSEGEEELGRSRFEAERAEALKGVHSSKYRAQQSVVGDNSSYTLLSAHRGPHARVTKKEGKAHRSTERPRRARLISPSAPLKSRPKRGAWASDTGKHVSRSS